MVQLVKTSAHPLQCSVVWAASFRMDACVQPVLLAMHSTPVSLLDVLLVKCMCMLVNACTYMHMHTAMVNHLTIILVTYSNSQYMYTSVTSS